MQRKETAVATMTMTSLPVVITVLILLLFVLASNLLQTGPQADEQGALAPGTTGLVEAGETGLASAIHESAALGPRPEDRVPTVDHQPAAAENTTAGALSSPANP